MNDMGSKAKTFFQRPEGKTGALFLVLLAAGAGWGLFLILPALIVLLENVIYAGVLAGFIGLVAFLAADNRVRTLVSYMYKSLMRTITGAFIEIDPIGILNGYVEDIEKRLASMRKSMADLAGQIRKLKDIIAQNEQKRQQSLQMAKLAHERADQKPAFILQSRKAGRLKDSNLTLQALLNKMEALSKVLKKMYETSEFLAEDIKGEVEVKTMERNAIKASHNVFTSAVKIIQGDADQKALFDQAMEHLADDYAMKVGEIEQFMEMSEGFIKSVDLENGVYEAEALEQFDNWSKRADQLLLRVDTSSEPKLPKGPRVAAYEEEAETEAREGSFADLFNKH